MGKQVSVRAVKTPKPFHLFVYGTLMSPMVFRAVLGYRLGLHPSEADAPGTVRAREATLAGYQKISPDDTYLYAVPEPAGRIRGYVVGPVPGECLAALHHYEGRNYRRVRVSVATADGPVKAYAFVANLDQLSHSFGWEFRDHYKQEILLRQKIDKAMIEDELNRLRTGDEPTRRALGELHGLTVRDLVRRHFEAGGISTFAIRQALRDEPLREFGDVLTDPQARPLANRYLAMLVRQVLFNQIEDRIRDDFRYELDQMQVSEKFYERTISALAALRLLNEESALVDLTAGGVVCDMPFPRHRLLEYVRQAVLTADALYSAEQAQRQIRYIQTHMGRGAIPLGAELEFSNIGHDVVTSGAAAGADPWYDGFLFFRDFGLDILTWKLGGHVDDHRVKTSTQRRRGFFELAFGSLSVAANISKPITDDPWLLNQMIHAAMDFYAIRPHSLHISMQLRSGHRPVQKRHMPLGVMKCLFALAGEAVAGGGRVRISRIARQEILSTAKGTQMLFSSISRRRSSEEMAPGEQGRWVQQYKFMRLSRQINYEPLVMALKGLQIHFKPGSFMTDSQCRTNPAMAELFRELVAWGDNATQLDRQDIEQFLSAVSEGLLREHRGKPAHSPAYIAYCQSQLRAGLDEFNALFAPGPRP